MARPTNKDRLHRALSASPLQVAQVRQLLPHVDSLLLDEIQNGTLSCWYEGESNTPMVGLPRHSSDFWCTRCGHLVHVFEASGPDSCADECCVLDGFEFGCTLNGHQ